MPSKQLTRKFSILIAKVTNENYNSQIFTKEATATKWDDSINEGSAISAEDALRESISTTARRLW